MATILIFDSGMGGLSVYREVRKALPGHQYLYLFDNACFPYGELSEQRLVARVSELFDVFVARHHIDIAVIACNTASTYVLPALRQQLTVPVVGVVPAIKPAAAHSRAHGHGKVGLLATPGTVSRDYTAQLIRHFAADLEVSLLGTTELVKMAEDKLAGLAVDRTLLGRVLAPWLGASAPDTVVLGCTHFPLLADEIQQWLPESLLVDSGSAIARRVSSLLAEYVEATGEPVGLAFCTRETEKARLQAGAFVNEGFGVLELFTP
ncbi:glutamate racemase [Zobellella endophytica]|uniref:Glutamate racemase n=1 Tax=Zobellella endophytica TaxID=2116700 RepID=A0A2P7R565_9GAMM|nr:glutamate racemase [Zobellella endophytica]PSJ45353.1 glutamate racemase [Zobellella endophytica]